VKAGWLYIGAGATGDLRVGRSAASALVAAPAIKAAKRNVFIPTLLIQPDGEATPHAVDADSTQPEAKSLWRLDHNRGFECDDNRAIYVE
jgi:hypothetical protein